MSLPLWERGLKFFVPVETFRARLSLPLWERGLKSLFHRASVTPPQSLPLWERGLKLTIPNKHQKILRRSPCGSVD